MSLIRLTSSGLYCEAGGFSIDPWESVDQAVITHAHADHARPGSKHYLTARGGEGVLRARMGDEPSIEPVEYGTPTDFNGVRVSLHPAGHILGSAQVRVERGGEVWVVSGDYKLEPDPTCTAFEPVTCHTFVTESTFGLPIYRWPRQESILADINQWWRSNQEAGQASLLFAYALGKSQRVIAGVDPSIGPIYTHGAVERVNEIYRDAGVALPPTLYAGGQPKGTDWTRGLIVAPPSAQGGTWRRRFGNASTAFVSGWMLIRGTRRRRSVDRGFPLSDHADWPGLLQAIQDTGAERVYVTHGTTLAMERWLREQGLDAHALDTRFEGEQDDADA